MVKIIIENKRKLEIAWTKRYLCVIWVFDWFKIYAKLINIQRRTVVTYACNGWSKTEEDVSDVMMKGGGEGYRGLYKSNPVRLCR